MPFNLFGADWEAPRVRGVAPRGCMRSYAAAAVVGVKNGLPETFS